MDANRDFVDLFASFNANGVESLVVGAHALAAHGHVRATKALDVWVAPTPANAQRVLRALRAFGAPTADLSAADLSAEGLVFQIGVAPVRIDILTSIDGVRFDEAWPAKVDSTFGGQPVFVIGKEDLVRNKRASGRLQDLADVERLLAPDEAH